MAQYRTGTATVTNGDATVTGVGTSWLSNLSIGDIFIRIGDSVPYFVGSITNDTSLELTAPYVGVTGSGVSYAVTTDFTPNSALGLLSPTDLETAITFNANMTTIDEGLTAIPVDTDNKIFNAVGRTQCIAIPAFSMGASGIIDEYLVLCPEYVSGNVNTLRIDGYISGYRGSDMSGNKHWGLRIKLLRAWQSAEINQLYEDGVAGVFPFLSRITIDGTPYFALKAQTTGGGYVADSVKFVGDFVNSIGDTNVFTRVRASDANVTVVDGTYAPMPNMKFTPTSGLIIDGLSGASGTFTTTDGKTVTVTGGFVTAII